MSPKWKIHEDILREHRRLVSNSMDDLWRDAMNHVESFGEDPHAESIFNSARHAHSQLFDLMQGLLNAIKVLEERDNVVLSASARPDSVE